MSESDQTELFSDWGAIDLTKLLLKDFQTAWATPRQPTRSVECRRR